MEMGFEVYYVQNNRIALRGCRRVNLIHFLYSCPIEYIEEEKMNKNQKTVERVIGWTNLPMDGEDEESICSVFAGAPMTLWS